MSAPQWKPGDVAMVTAGRSTYVAVRTHWYGNEKCDEPHWISAQGRLYQVTDARPLVVIDPEDRQRVERLARAYCEQSSGRGAPLQPEETWHMQEALRSLVTPEEPQGLGAVVEADGRRWVRGAERMIDPWRPTSGPANWRSFNEFTDIRVLSEGWSE